MVRRSRRQSRRSSQNAQRHRTFKPQVESLESRRLLTVNVVADAFDVRQGDGAARFGVLDNDQVAPDYAGDVRITSVSTGSEGGQLQIIEDGQAISYLPPSHFHGDEQFQYSVDGQFSNTVTVTVQSPVRDDAISLDGRPETQNLDVLSNDPFWDDYQGEGKITLIGQSALGHQVKIAPDGKSLTFQRVGHVYGSDTIDYVVDDTHLATVTIWVSNALARDDVDTLQNAGPKTYNVIANDPFYAGYTGERRVTHVLDAPEQATATISDDGRSITLTPIEDYEGFIAVRYVVDNLFEQRLTLEVDNPLRSDAFDVSGDSQILNVLSNDDVGSESRIVSVTDPEGGGSVAISAEGRFVEFTRSTESPNSSDRFSYRTNENFTTTVYIRPRGGGGTRAVQGDFYRQYLGDAEVPLNVLANDGFPDDYDGPREITDVTFSETVGTFVVSADKSRLLYTAPTSDGDRQYFPQDVATYEIDGQFTATVRVSVSRPLVNDSFSVTDQLPRSFYVLENDHIGPYSTYSRTISSVTQPDNGGQVAIGANGTVRVVPGVGVTAFTYTVGDQTATVHVNYVARLAGDSTVVDQNSEENAIDVLLNDFGSTYLQRKYGAYTGARLITGTRGLTAGASVLVAADGKSLSYSPPADFAGRDSFEYVVDGFMTASVSVDVIRRVEDDAFHVLPQSTENVFPVMLNDLLGSDYRGQSHITSVTTADAGATVAIGADSQTLVYTPSAESNGRDTLTYTVDGRLIAEVDVFVTAEGIGRHEPFGSQGEFDEFLVASAIQRFYVHDGYISRSDSLEFVGLNAGADVAFSDTNTQVNGVDEADVVENDGYFLYTLAGNEIVITEVDAATTLDVVSRTRVEGTPVGIYLNGDRLTVIAKRFTYNLVESNVLLDRASVTDGYFPPQSTTTLVSVYDVADRANPVLVQGTRLDGKYIESRRVDDTVFVVTDAGWMNLPVPTYDEGGERETQAEYATRLREELPSLMSDLLPGYSTYDTDGELVRSGLLVAPEDIFQPITADAQSMLTVSSIDMGNSDGGLLSTQGVMSSYGTKVYASLDNLYVFADNFDSADRRSVTDIAQFAWNGETGAVDFTATGQVVGTMNDQFSADEFDGNLRIATTVGNRNAGNFTGRDENALFVLNEDGGVLEHVGSLHNLALNERIQSVRFAGDRALVVTFRSVDPLFGVDLADPTNPFVVGALSLPGFSEYQQFIDDDHILTIGQNASRGLAATAISLFNVSDLANPRLVDIVAFPRGATSIAAADHHAFGWFGHHQILALPSARYYTERQDIDEDGYAEADVPRTEHELFAYRVDVTADNPISLLGSVVEDSVIQRAAFVEDTLYTIAHDSIQSSRIDDPAALIERVEWDVVPKPVNGSVWLPLTDRLSEPLQVLADAAVADLAQRLDVAESTVMRVTSEDKAVVLRSGDRQYLYTAGTDNEVDLQDDDFAFESYVPSHNVSNGLDVNGDGHVTPLDAIITINELNDPVVDSVRALDHRRATWFTDTNGDGAVVPLDALRIINALNATTAPQPASQAVQSAALSFALTDLVFAADEDSEDDN